MSTHRLADPTALLEAARAGDRAALGRLISLVERGGPASRQVSRATFATSAGVRHVVGVTGAPGAGKSSLTDRFIGLVRQEGESVGVLAVDPSSPYTGGALLADRLRMQGHAIDEGVFIRSMASRGHHGGLAAAAPQAVRVLAAAGIPVVIVETVGVGQVEVEVAGEVDTTVMVVTPGWGDWVQAAKAGLIEAADVFIVNKADLPGAASTKRDLDAILDMGRPDIASSERVSTAIQADRAAWRPPVVLASASSGEGVVEAWAAVCAHRDYLENSGLLAERREQRLVAELRAALARRVEAEVLALEEGEAFAEVRSRLLSRQIDPQEAADILVSGA
jgi:LAO/AO transport system kinase